jgi:cellulose synthase/poly-beta-1,6-N-acetylglucosamine synthase-like glycosyltransferase
LPEVTAVIAAHNEQAHIVARVRNLLDSAYDPDKLSVLVVDDGSTDQTVAQLRTIGAHRVRVLCNQRQLGKAACLNQAIAEVETEIVVFTDARQSFAPDAIRRLIGHFSDPKVGAVSGALVLPKAATGIGNSVGLYWTLERRLRMDEARWDSAIGCTGAIYGIRTALFRPIPEDTILDDVVVPMHILQQGYRVLYDMDAVAVEPRETVADTEARRKRRTLAGNFQMLFRYPAWLLPWRNRAWWQLLSHKYLRLAAPLFLALALVSNVVLRAEPLYQGLLGLQLLFYGAALLGLMLPQPAPRLTAVPAGFLFLNLNVVQGLWDYLRGTYARGWKRG